MRRRNQQDVEEERPRGRGLKSMLLLLMTVIAGAIIWQIGEKLSSDAISMGLGMLLGMLAGIPAALLMLASERRRASEVPDARGHHQALQGYSPPYGAQPPVIVLTGQGTAPPQQQPHANHGFQDGAPGWSEPRRAERHFKVVGETEEWIDEW